MTIFCVVSHRGVRIAMKAIAIGPIVAQPHVHSSHKIGQDVLGKA